MINFQNSQAAHITKYQKNKQANQKMGGGRPKQTFLHRRQETDKKILNIIHY